MRHFTCCLAVLGALLVVSPAFAEAPKSAPPPTPSSSSGAPDAPGEKVPVLALDLEGIGVDADRMKIINGAVVDALFDYSEIEIIAQADIRQMVSFEAQRQSMGCDESSCLAELAGAMGAQYVVYGRVGLLDDVLFVQLNLFDSAKGRAVAREEVRAAKLSELPDLLRPALARLVTPLTGEVPPPARTHVAAPSATPAADGGRSISGPVLWSGAALAGVGLVAGVGLGAGALWAESTLGTIDARVADKDMALEHGPWMFVGAVGGAAVAVGGLALASAAFFLE